MAHSALASREWMPPWLTFGIRLNIIERDLFARSTQRCLRSMASCWRNRYSRDGLCRPCRDSTYLESVVPALKRWAIVTAPPCESFYPALKRWAIFELQRRHARRSRLTIIEHALKVRFSNHKLNKSRGSEVERLVNLF